MMIVLKMLHKFKKSLVYLLLAIFAGVFIGHSPMSYLAVAIKHQQNQQPLDPFSFASYAKTALKTDAGFQAYFQKNVAKATYHFFEKLQKVNKAYAYDFQTKQNNDQQTLASLKKTNPIQFQQEVLDSNFGSQENYLQNSLSSYSYMKLRNEAFQTLFLTIYDTQTKKIIPNPSKEVILQALEQITNQKPSNYVFSINSQSALASNEDSDVFYAKLQAFVLQKFIEYTNPMIINKIT